MSEQDLGIRTVFVNHRATSRRLRKAKLVVLDGQDAGKEFVIGQSRVFAGRGAVNDIVLTDQSISGTHFELRAEDDGFLLRDLGSTNGTRLAKCRVREVFIEARVTFQAGNSTLQLIPVEEEVEIPLADEEHFGDVIGGSVAMREIFASLKKVAPTELTCLIEGDTGTGKERVARAIHEQSRRRAKPFVVLDCSSIPRDLMESYVFGHEKGAFTGAHAQRTGAFEQANGGTLFLDEIGELEIDLQPKLLRVLENSEFKRVGGARTHRADVRVLAATNRNLRQMVTEGRFREDLYFRLSIVNVLLPPLAERREDIIPLAEHFLEQVTANQPERERPLRMSAEAIDALMRHGWPGNVRELKNVMVRAGSLTAGHTIERADLLMRSTLSGPPSPVADNSTAAPALAEEAPIDLSVPFKDAKQEVVEAFEARYLEALMTEHGGNISKASRSTGITRYHLRELLKKYELR